MNKIMKRSIVSAAIALVLLTFVFISCSDDIVLPPLDTLLGEYEGNYRLTDLSQGGSGVTRVDIAISWRFTDNAYFLDDTSATICSPSGDYVLSGDQLTFDQKFSGTDICDSTLSPYGNFSIRRPLDSVIISQLENDIFIEIRLKKTL